MTYRAEKPEYRTRTNGTLVRCLRAYVPVELAEQVEARCKLSDTRISEFCKVAIATFLLGGDEYQEGNVAMEVLQNEVNFYRQRATTCAAKCEQMAAQVSALTLERDKARSELIVAQDAAKLAIDEADKAAKESYGYFQQHREASIKEAKRLRKHLKYLIGCAKGIEGEVKREDAENLHLFDNNDADHLWCDE